MVYCDLFAHSDQLTERMNFIQDFTKCGTFMLSLEHLTLLWHEVIEDNILSSDHKEVYTWFNKMCEDVLKDGLSLVDQDVLIAFFKEKINSDETNFQNLSIEGYYCIQSFFVLINKRAKKIIILGEEIITPGTVGAASRPTAAANTSHPSITTNAQGKVIKTASIDPEKLDVQVRVAPNELEGISGLWKIAIDSQDKKVGESVTKMILQLHTDVDFGMESQIPVFEDQFISSCFGIIAQ